jgi:maleylacetoacetate isomerase
VALLPDDAAERARVRALAIRSPWTFTRFAIFRWSRHVLELTGGGDAMRVAWMQRFISAGAGGLREMLDHPETGHILPWRCTGAGRYLPDPAALQCRTLGRDISGLNRIQASGRPATGCRRFANAHPDRTISRT